MIPEQLVAWIAQRQDIGPFLLALLFLQVVDIVTGVIAAWIEGKISSAASWVGMGKKVLVILAISMGAVLEPFVGLPLGKVVASYYLFTEAISITENLKRAGVPIPKALRDALENKAGNEDEPAAK